MRKPTLAQSHKNRMTGAYFEQVLKCRAGVDGMLAVKNELAFKYLPGGKVLPIRANLDFAVFNGQGRVGYVDCKAFDAEYFTYSQLDARQLQRAILYASYRVPAGFVVWLNKANLVVFYSGHTIGEAGPGTRFGPQHGVVLGAPLTFSLKGVFA